MNNILLSIALFAGFVFPPAIDAPVVETSRVLGDSTSIEITNPLPAIPDKSATLERVKHDEPPVISARSAIVVDAASGSVLYEKNADDVIPIASLTKVLTWVTFYDLRKNWDAPVALSEYNNRLTGAKLREDAGEHMTLSDLAKTALVGSANNATEALAETTGLTLDEFNTAMNAKANALGAETLFVTEPTGLSEFNVSSARDYWKLLRYARHFEDMTGPLTQNIHEFVTLDNGRYHRIKGTNKFAGRDDLPLVMAKTGYTDEAGWCLGTVLNAGSGDVIVVVFGAENTSARFNETERLYNYVIDQFDWI